MLRLHLHALIVRVSGILDIEVLIPLVTDPVVNRLASGVVQLNLLNNFLAQNTFEYNWRAFRNIVRQRLQPENIIGNKSKNKDFVT